MSGQDPEKIEKDLFLAKAVFTTENISTRRGKTEADRLKKGRRTLHGKAPEI